MIVFDADRRLRVVVFFSGGASGFRYLWERDTGYGEAYEVVGGFTDDPGCSGVDYVEAAGVPVESSDLRAFYADRDADLDDMDVRAEFDAETRERIHEFDADLVMLSGYMWILTAPIVENYPVLNVHPADLTITDDGERVYVGADPVRDAVLGGEAETRSSVHFVTPGVDEGALLVRSRAFDVNRKLVDALLEYDADHALDAYVDAHQEWMKWEGDGPALAAALELIAAGRVQCDGSTVRVDGEPGFYQLGGDEETA